ncbi:Ldh family oxidoreductase [Streptomyces sp. DH10]|uniref:Ldh family oxidoreductase n=1 Tax=Streptomyces sp. DH10 TaxID=3040121 RepID=UPI00244160B3|nr:Ldh family oxidoreductase [Streptomyces sp. DH10]MDG9712474.1 Ldh family oxidoreductase [Streptomyces sp. DH10]
MSHVHDMQHTTAAGDATAAAPALAPLLPATTAVALAETALTRAGLSPDDARDVAHALTETSLRGIDTHGLRLLPQYLDELADAIATARPKIRTIRDSGAAAMLDADGALGVVAGLAAARFAAERARTHGVAAVGVRNSNHFGAASVYSRYLAKQGMVGIVTTSAASRVAPFSGTDPLFGTNPLSFAAAAEGDEFALDMATSQVCFGEIKERRKHGRTLDAGWATDTEGRPATDPEQAYALSPLGGYKGQGLAMVATLLGAVLTGSPADWELEHIGASTPGRSRGIGHLVICLDPAAFAGSEQFAAGLTGMLDTTRGARPGADAEQPVQVPGDPQRRIASERAQKGIPLDPHTAQAFAVLATEQGVAWPEVST